MVITLTSTTTVKVQGQRTSTGAPTYTAAGIKSDADGYSVVDFIKLA